MAINASGWNYHPTPVIGLPGFQKPANSPVMQPMGSPGIGGGTPPAPVALDPRGLVPVARTQPVATDGGEAQRLLERRLGTMPPSSFAGSGAGFVPVDRPVPPMALNPGAAPVPVPSVASPAVATTDLGYSTQPSSVTPLSAEATADVARQNLYNGQPDPADHDPHKSQLATTIDAKRRAGADARTARQQNLINHVLANLQTRLTPAQFAVARGRILSGNWGGVTSDGQPPNMGTAADFLRQHLAAGAPGLGGLTGLGGLLGG